MWSRKVALSRSFALIRGVRQRHMSQRTKRLSNIVDDVNKSAQMGDLKHNFSNRMFWGEISRLQKDKS